LFFNGIQSLYMYKLKVGYMYIFKQLVTCYTAVADPSAGTQDLKAETLP